MFRLLFWLGYLELDDGALVLVGVAVVRRGEDGDHLREGLAAPVLSPVAFELHFVRADEGDQLVVFQEGAEERGAEDVRAASGGVGLDHGVIGQDAGLVVDGVRPYEVAGYRTIACRSWAAPGSG